MGASGKDVNEVFGLIKMCIVLVVSIIIIKLVKWCCLSRGYTLNTVNTIMIIITFYTVLKIIVATLLRYKIIYVQVIIILVIYSGLFHKHVVW